MFGGKPVAVAGGIKGEKVENWKGSNSINLLLEQTGNQNLVKIVNNGTTHNLAYLDPDMNGKAIYSNFNFIDANSAEISEVLQVVEQANFRKANNTVAYNKKFTIVKTNTGLIRVVDGGVSGAGDFANQIDNTITRLTGNANFSLNGTGKYKTVAGHHPMAKKAFEGDLAYDYKEAFSVSTSELDNAAGIANIHPSITGQQNSLYTAWRNANPSKKLTIDEMADIEIQAMVNVGIPQDIATGWVVKSLEDLRLQGVTEIKNIPWNGTN